ncbi:AraC family transcriptional regulator [Martelella lutilitoris]|uniref:AraC family transcriptional regulator n=1 Tax=Martelella lutilitoris TaxID=2583532 RepID=A0A5C4JUB6_9HYPH|nr:AraC family transcriptional regulator [Martelella lutilitoris]TNB49008.1 AraC family transcriptional regulator [Martelella lutilitoris]
MPKSGNPVALARLRGIGPLPAMIEDAAGDRGLIRTFRDAGLPLEVLDHKDMPIPLSLMSALFENGARTLGDRTFGLSVGRRMSYRVYGHWSDYSGQAGDLAGALQRACATVGSQLLGSKMEFGREHDRWFWRVTPRLGRENSVQYSDHIIFPMLAFARIYLGADWRPDYIEVGYPRDKAALSIETALQTGLRCGRRGVAIPFSEEELARPHPAMAAISLRPLTLKAVTDDVLLKDAPEPARSFSAIVTLRLLAGESDIEGAAEIAGYGVQGLQRRLRITGYTYREVLETARCKRAQTLLSETDLSVSQIAFALGYEEHANFSRAFQRWMGCSPSAFRARVANTSRPRA